MKSLFDIHAKQARRARPLAALLLGALLAGSLQGCFPLLAGGTVMGAMAVTDRRTLGAQTDDTTIAVKGEARAEKVVGDRGHVNVNSFNRRVLLTGEVKDAAMKAEVAKQVAGIDNVVSVENELVVGPASSFSDRSKDAYVGGKVRAAIIDNKDLSLNAFKVVTERGVVYLMGRVTENEGAIAAEVARNASPDIKKIVKLFEYISEQELKELQAKAQESKESQDAKPAGRK